MLDNTPFREDLTIVSRIAVHSRVLPVAWAVMPAQTKWDEGQWDIVGRGGRPGACASARHILNPTRRSWVSRHADAASFVPIVGGIMCYGCVQSIRGLALFHGKLEQSWKCFDQIVRHRAAIAGMAQPESGKRKRWRRTSVWSGTQVVRNRDSSSAIRVPCADRFRSMPGAWA